MKFVSQLIISTLAFFLTSSAMASLIYSIDVDSTVGGGGPIETESGWSSLDASGTANGSSVVVGGVNFSISSADSSRIRRSGGTPNPNKLTSDFVFDDGSGQAVIMNFGGAGALEQSLWQVEVWSNDASAQPDNQILGWRRNNAETIVSTSVTPSAVGPAHTFIFYSDGVGAYDVFLRENGNNRTRLNAVRLTRIVPEPSTGLILSFVTAGAFLRRRRRRF